MEEIKKGNSFFKGKDIEMDTKFLLETNKAVRDLLIGESNHNEINESLEKINGSLTESGSHPALVKPTEQILNAIIKLRQVIGNEYKSMSYSSSVPAYLKNDDKKLEKIYKEIEKLMDSYSR